MNRQIVRVCWMIALPLLTLLTTISWFAASPLGVDNPLIATAFVLVTSCALLTTLAAGVYWALGAKKVLEPSSFYAAALSSTIIGLITATPLLMLLLNSAPKAEMSNDQNVIASTGSAYLLSVFAMPAVLSAVLLAVTIFMVGQAKGWSAQSSTIAVVIACSLVICLGAGLLAAGQKAALSPTASPPSRPQSSAIATPDPNASALPPECPMVKTSSVQAVRIPASNPESMVTSVLNTYSSWLNSGTELMRLSEWRAAPAHCTSLLASAYGNAYTSSIFTNQVGAAWLQYFNSQVTLNARLLEAIRTINPDTDHAQPSAYRLDQIIDTSSNSSGSYLKFDATLVSTANVDWQGTDKKARWYVQLIPWEEFYIIDYIEAI